MIDTHCHIHESSYDDDGGALARAQAAGITAVLVVGTDLASSECAIAFAKSHENAWPTIGVHPHESSNYAEHEKKFKSLLGSGRVVAIGECGLDYFYNHASKNDQIYALHAQLSLAAEHDLPVIFHVREAFDDFWPVFNQYPGIRGVLHSFTDSLIHLNRGLSEGLYIGVNGIATFTKDPSQLEMLKSIPSDRILLETDAPFLTPVPKRGKVNEPANLVLVAQFLSDLRNENLLKLSEQTSRNATTLFQLNK